MSRYRRATRTKHMMVDSGIDFFRALTNTSPLPTLVTNDRAEIIYVNSAWERQFGYKQSEVVGKNPRILQSGKTQPDVYIKMWETLKAGKPFQTTEVIDKRKNGSYFNLSSTVYPVQSSGRLHYVQILDDITETKRTAEFQKQFIRIAAHDIRAPLQNLDVLTEIVTMEHGDESTRALRAEIRRLEALAAILLDVGQIEAGKIVLHTRDFDIAELVHSVAQAQYAYPGRIVSVAKTQCIVHADRERIEQVLRNLIENALKYAGADVPVYVSVTEEGSRVIASVTDAGRGISIADQKHIFDPYFRSNDAKSSLTAGSGLGLHIVREVVRAHGAELNVRSKPGKGSAFWFELLLVKSNHT